VTTDTRKKTSMFNRLINVFRPAHRKNADIVAQAEAVLDRYAGGRHIHFLGKKSRHGDTSTDAIRYLRRRARYRTAIKVLNTAIFAVCGVIVFLLWKIFVP